MSLGVGLGFATGAALLWRGDMAGLVAAGLCLGGAAALGLSAQPLTDLTFLTDGAPSPTSIELPALVEPLAMKELDGGTFLMGSAPEEDPGHYKDEAPVHLVQVSPFAMALHPVTQRLYREVTGSLPKLTFEGDELPIIDVNWFDAARFCNLLSEKVGLRPCYQFTADGETVSWDRSANGYRLPTEAEWEYAARAGTRTPWSCPEDQLGEHAWYNENSQDQVQPVGKKKANPFGLFDMHGNVYEWCWDWYGSYPRSPVEPGSLPDEASTAIEPPLDPLGPLTGDQRLLRGGSFAYGPRFLRSSVRFRFEPALRVRVIGFRCVRGSRRSFDPSSS